MFHRFRGLFVPLLVLAVPGAVVPAQEQSKPLNPGDSRLVFTFPVQPGEKPLEFDVELDKVGYVTGVSVYRDGEDNPVQTLPICTKPLEPITEDWQDYDLAKLVAHADFNFDGFEDLELLSASASHLGTKIYCIYPWDPKAGRFVYSKQLSAIAVNLEPHPENKTLVSHQDWSGGPWQESIYRLKKEEPELIEESSLLGGWSQQTKEQCGFTFTCSKLINGKMVVTLSKPICTVEEMDDLPDCPGPPVQPTPEPPPVPEVRGVANPPNVTSVKHKDNGNGLWEDDFYHWNGQREEMVGLRGMFKSNPGDKCAHIFACAKIVNGEKIFTTLAPVCTDRELHHPPKCPPLAPPNPSAH
jgi:hypothetical protein